MSQVTYTKCDGCGQQETDPWPPYIPLQLTAGERGEEGWTVRSGDFCQQCAQDVLEKFADAAKLLPLRQGHPGGTALLAFDTDDDPQPNY